MLNKSPSEGHIVNSTPQYPGKSGQYPGQGQQTQAMPPVYQQQAFQHQQQGQHMPPAHGGGPGGPNLPPHSNGGQYGPGGQPPKSKTGLIVGIIVGIIVIAAAVVLVIFLMKDDGGEKPADPKPVVTTETKDQNSLEDPTAGPTDGPTDDPTDGPSDSPSPQPNIGSGPSKEDVLQAISGGMHVDAESAGIDLEPLYNCMADVMIENLSPDRLQEFVNNPHGFMPNSEETSRIDEPIMKCLTDNTPNLEDFDIPDLEDLENLDLEDLDLEDLENFNWDGGYDMP